MNTILVEPKLYYRLHPFPQPFGSVISKGRSIPVYKIGQTVKPYQRTLLMSTINLSKGESVNLTKLAPALATALLGAGWDPVAEGASMDLDLAVLACKADGKMIDEKRGLIFFNNLEAPDGSITHQGDNRTGQGDGDDEKIDLDFTKLDPAVTKLVAVAVIYQAGQKQQNLSQLKNAFVRVVDKATNTELAKYTIDGSMSGDTLTFGEFTKDANNEWSFKAIGASSTGELKALIDQYGYQQAA